MRSTSEDDDPRAILRPPAAEATFYMKQADDADWKLLGQLTSFNFNEEPPLVPVTVIHSGAPDLDAWTPIPMRLPCPDCGALHVDEGEFATKPHHTHACQECGMVWRPAVEHTVGVRFLPGYRNETERDG